MITATQVGNFPPPQISNSSQLIPPGNESTIEATQIGNFPAPTNKLGWPEGNASFTSKAAAVLNAGAQASNSALAGLANVGQSIYNMPHTISTELAQKTPLLNSLSSVPVVGNILEAAPLISKITPDNTANMANVIGSITGVPMQNNTLNNLSTSAGEAFGGAFGGGLDTAEAGANALTKAFPGAVKPTLANSIETPISSDYMQAVTNSGGAQRNLDSLATQAQSVIPKLYAQDVANSTEGMGSIGKNGVAQVGDYVKANYQLALQQAKDQMNAYQQYGDEIPTHLQPAATPAKLSPGAPLKAIGSSSPQELVDNWDTLSPARKQLYLQNGNVVQTGGEMTTPEMQVQQWLGDDLPAVKTAMGTNNFAKYLKNPSISGNYDLARAVGEAGAAAQKTGTGANLFGLQQKIFNEGVMQPLQSLDDANGTNAAATVQNGRQLFKTNVLPYRANSALNSMANGNFASASPQEAANAIEAAQSGPSATQKISTDPETGLNISKVGANHALSTILPDFQRLAQYTGNNALTNLTAGRAALSGDDLASQLNSAATNNSFDASHPFSELQNDMNQAVSARDSANQQLSDNQLLQDAKAQQDALQNKNNLLNYNNKLAEYNSTAPQQLKNVGNAILKHKVAAITGAAGLGLLNHLF